MTDLYKKKMMLVEKSKGFFHLSVVTYMAIFNNYIATKRNFTIFWISKFRNSFFWVFNRNPQLEKERTNLGPKLVKAWRSELLMNGSQLREEMES